MTTKLIFRVLNAAGDLLGWTEHYARAKGDGQLWTTSTVSVPIDVAGDAVVLSMHWADVHVETRVPFPSAPHHVNVGDTITVFGDDMVAMVVGPTPAALPSVTVRGSVQVAVPVGILAGVGVR